MPKIIKTLSYVIPMFGNTHNEPYGKLLIEHNGKTYKTEIRSDENQTFVIIDRKHYPVKNTGTLYHPNFEFV